MRLENWEISRRFYRKKRNESFIFACDRVCEKFAPLACMLRIWSIWLHSSTKHRWKWEIILNLLRIHNKIVQFMEQQKEDTAPTSPLLNRVIHHRRTKQNKINLRKKNRKLIMFSFFGYIIKKFRKYEQMHIRSPLTCSIVCRHSILLHLQCISCCLLLFSAYHKCIAVVVVAAVAGHTRVNSHFARLCEECFAKICIMIHWTHKLWLQLSAFIFFFLQRKK